jgi:competence protein ComEC
MRSAIIGFVCGVACLQTLAVLPGNTRLALIGLAALLVAACPLPAAASGVASALRAAIAGSLLGFAWAALLAHAGLAPRLAPADEGRDLTIVGTVDSLPYVFEDGVRFNFKVEQVLAAEGASTAAPSTAAPAVALPPRLALSWYAGFAGRPQAPVGDVQPGERWRLTVRLQRPHGNANPGGFDYEVWLLEEGVRATGYVRSEAGPGAAGNARLAPFVASFNNVVERCRAILRARILATLNGKPYAGVIVALVVGDQRAIDQDDWLVFSRTGVSHLISVSGL